MSLPAKKVGGAGDATALRGDRRSTRAGKGREELPCRGASRGGIRGGQARGATPFTRQGPALAHRPHRSHHIGAKGEVRMASAASALTTLRPQGPTDVTLVAQPAAPPPTPVAARYLTTADAARYCGFKTASAIRKAHMEGRVKPIARRGGKGTWVWSVANLDRFMRGEPPLPSAATVPVPDRSGAPPAGGADEQAEAGEVEVVQGKLDLDRTGAAARLAAEGGRARRSCPRDGQRARAASARSGRCSATRMRRRR